jgi:hypothetical protein
MDFKAQGRRERTVVHRMTQSSWIRVGQSKLLLILTFLYGVLFLATWLVPSPARCEATLWILFDRLKRFRTNLLSCRIGTPARPLLCCAITMLKIARQPSLVVGHELNSDDQRPPISTTSRNRKDNFDSSVGQGFRISKGRR